MLPWGGVEQKEAGEDLGLGAWRQRAGDREYSRQEETCGSEQAQVLKGGSQGGGGGSGKMRRFTAAFPPPWGKSELCLLTPYCALWGSICRAQSPESGLRAQITPP